MMPPGEMEMVDDDGLKACLNGLPGSLLFPDTVLGLSLSRSNSELSSACSVIVASELALADD